MDDTTEAITLLYRREGGAVYRTIYAIVLNTGEARDLTRETFVRACRAWDRFEGDGGGGSEARVWLLCIAAALAITREREARRRWDRVPLTPDEAAAVDDPGRQAEDQDLVAWLMRPLTPEQRALVALCCYQQVPPDEFAAQLGMSARTVPARLNRAMQILRERAQAVGAMQPAEYAAR